MARDPVCGMMVDEETAKFKTTYEGKTYYFCAPGCKAAFEENPRKYLGKEAKPMAMPHMSHMESKKKPWWKFW